MKIPAPDYAELRRRAYPPLADQLDAQWKGGEAAEAMRQAIAAVKARYPKPAAEAPALKQRSDSAEKNSCR